VHALADESGRLVIELHEALQEMDPARWNRAAAAALRERLAAIRERLTGVTEAPWPTEADRLRDELRQVGDALDAVPDPEGSLASARSAWMAFRQQLVPRYEAARTALREYAIHVPSLRPTNYARSFFHVLMATVTLTILWLLPDPVWGIAILAPLFVWAWTTERLRRSRPELNAKVMKLFGPVAHPHEKARINSATWYTTALFLLSFTRAPLVCAVGIAVLGFGDPLAALIGRKIGRLKLIHGRTLEGSLAFFVAGGLAAFGVGWLFAPSVALPSLLAVAGAGSAGGALAELLSLRIDDNLSVPLIATGCASLAAWALGVPL